MKQPLHELAQQYSDLSLEKSRIEDLMAELKPKIIKQLKPGNSVPVAGNLKLLYTQYDRTKFSWKSYAELVAKKLWGKEAKEKTDSAIKKAGKSPVDKLEVVPDPEGTTK